MPDIENQIENQEEQESYADIINEMRANTVSKDKYNRLEEENKKLMKALAKGETIEVEAPETPDVKELRKSLYTDEVSNLSDIEFVQKTLQLRKAIMDDGGIDPFVASGHRITPDDEAFNVAEKVADVLQQCIDYADGDNAVFINELQRRTVDSAPMTPGTRRRR